VEIKNGDKFSVYGSSDYIPLRLRQMGEAVVIRIVPNSGSSPDWKLKHTKLNGVDLVVLSIERPCGSTTVKCMAADYFMPQGLLRIHVNHSMEKLYNGFEGFHGGAIPHSIVLSGGKGEFLTISIGSLETLSPSESKLLQDATPPANLPAIRLPIVPNKAKQAGVHTTAAKILNQTQPEYPQDAKQQREEGTVVMEATIDEDGAIREPFVIRSAGPLLDKAAMDAIRKWRYQPTTLEGQPISVNTTISVVFKLGP
jgi:TonB family protein